MRLPRPSAVGAFVVLALLGMGCSATDDAVHIAAAEVTAAGGLRITIDEPCPDGGAIEVTVAESEEGIELLAAWSDGQLVDCDGGAATSPTRTAAIALTARVGDRVIVDGSTGAEIPTSRP